MRFSLRIYGRGSGLEERDDTLVPAVCYDLCNNAYLEAQNTGKTPPLCEPKSLFMSYYNACTDCIATANPSSDEAITKTYLEPKFAQFINYCVGLSGNASVTATATVTSGIKFTSVATDFDTASLESKWSSIGRAASSEGFVVLPTNLVIVTTETSSASTTLPDGRVTTVPVTRILTIPNLSAWKFTVPTTGTGPSSSSSRPPSGEVTSSATPLTIDPPEASPSKAWIAGPVVGGLAAVVAVLGFFLFFIRPRRRRAAAMNLKDAQGDSAEKAQLHADSIPAKPPPQEMEGEANMYPELVVNEVPAAELPAEEVGQGPGGVHRHEM